MLRKEYLNQTFNFMPELRLGYDRAAKNQFYESAQTLVTHLGEYGRSNDTLIAAVDYFSQLEEYTKSSKEIVDGLTKVRALVTISKSDQTSFRYATDQSTSHHVHSQTCH